MVKRVLAAVLAGGVLFAAAVVESDDSMAGGEAAAPAEAVNAVAQLGTLLRHLEASGGDPRFAERLPAEPRLVAEIVGGVEWGSHLDHETDLEPVRFEIVAATLEGAVATIRTREMAIARFRSRAVRDGEADTRRPVVARWEYQVVRRAGVWRVEDWKALGEVEGTP
jgi:hypothetical protein